MDDSRRTFIAIFFAVLMATSMIAMPALAAGPSAGTVNERSTGVTIQGDGPPGHGDGPPEQNGGGPPGHDRGDANVTVPELEANTSIETAVNATERLGELDLETGENETDEADEPAMTAANETVAAVNASLQAYRHLEYVDSRESFERYADAQRSLADLADAVDEDDEAIVDEISRDLYAASDRSARLTVVDAKSVVAANDEEFRNPGQRQSAESALGNAIDALERANDTAGADSTPGHGSQDVDPADRAKATTHLENAWKHGERALDTVENDTEPTLSLSQERAFERNDSVVVPIQATLDDVRPYAYDEADVTIDGNGTADDFSLIAGESATSTASGTTFVDLGPEPENVTVTVTATAEHDDERTAEATQELRVDPDDVILDRPDPDEYQEVDVTDDSSGVAVEVGGDGLHESDISVRDETPAEDDSYRAGPMVRIESQQEFDEATVEIPIDDADLEREGNLSVVTWDPQSDEPWTPVETEIDADEGVATADVDGFSFFSVFWINDWEDETSDTITLDGNETDGDVGDGGSLEKADFTFVIDVSGSMRGDRIHYAREAAQRFVGAFEDDERGALVEFSSSASLVEGLTTDHDELNRSIQNLDAGGWTNTGGGLEEGIDELEANGWENRSSVMILLADGETNRGPDPVGVAEDAAEEGIEISSIGLGSSIDEDELRAIAGAADGDYYHVEDADDLPDTFDRVAENQTEVQLQDTNDDGIPDLVAEMDLKMPSGPPGVEGESLDLDPIALDTSGDGIQDNETVDINYRVHEENNETKLTAQVTHAAHHPAKVDTTGDGLTDREQLEDGWEIAYTDSREESLEVLGELEGAEDLDDLGAVDELFETTRVHANPLLNDTSGDGLSDREEVEELGTDPESTDTTGDGVPDADADDPTLFDISSPEVTVTYAHFDDPSASASVSVGWDGVDVDAELDTTGTYEVQFLAEDQAGLGEARIVQDGSVKNTTSLSGTSDGGTLEFETGTLSTFADLFEGTAVTVQVDDRHGPIEEVGTTEAEAIEVGGIFHQVSQELRAAGYTSAEVEEALGFLEGMTTGAGETLGGILAIYDDPHVIVEAAKAVPEAVENFDEIIEALPAAIEDQQQFNNPHDPGDQYYDDFRYGWYQGYFFWFVVEMAVPAGEAGKALKSTDTMQSTVDRISTPQVQRAAQIAKQGGQTATAPVRYSRQQLSRALTGSFSVADDAAHRLLPGRSTGKQVDNAHTTRQLDEGTVTVLADGGTTFREGVYKAADSDAVTSYRQIDRAVKRIDGLDGAANTRAKQLVRNSDGDGIRLIDRLDDGTFETLFRIEDGNGYNNFNQWDDWRSNLAKSSTNADPEDVNRYVENVRKAGENDAISNERGLVNDLTEENSQRSDFRGLRGEADTVTRYSEQVDDVRRIEVEPGDGDYDLRLERSQGDEFVEVKTPKSDTDLDFNYWKRQQSEMNKKYSNSPDVSRDQATLEVPVKRDSTDIELAQNELEMLIETPPAGDFSEVRMQVRDDSGIEIISISADPDT
ncbi:VWA domain-containing protein [Natronococcus pandeyae]|uniref:VWA domain-containing protein n=1 Tax=Natronococcus pandeyae TaxID=2055836 RepID=A0A8J8TR21_9EURY|nr:VWA domain-containing protein [Natronococcus pandeyae]TYL39486.1 VWA domain-containing protein [Natronococcus pandeyae]